MRSHAFSHVIARMCGSSQGQSETRLLGNGCKPGLLRSGGNNRKSRSAGPRPMKMITTSTLSHYDRLALVGLELSPSVIAQSRATASWANSVQAAADIRDPECCRGRQLELGPYETDEHPGTRPQLSFLLKSVIAASIYQIASRAPLAVDAQDASIAMSDRSPKGELIVWCRHFVHRNHSSPSDRHRRRPLWTEF